MSSTLIMIDANFPTKKSLFFFVPGVASDQPNESEIALGLSEDMLMDWHTRTRHHWFHLPWSIWQ